MKNKHFEHLLRVAISDNVMALINKSIHIGYEPIDNLFYDIDFIALAQGKIEYKKRSIEESLEHFNKFESQYIGHVILSVDIYSILNHPGFKGIITLYELQEMLEDKDLDLTSLIRDELIGIIKGTEHI